MTALTDELWSQDRYDSGWYLCRVDRKGERARLTVTLDGLVRHLLHAETVKVEGRIDADKFRQRCAQVISNPDLRNIEP